MAYGNLKVDSLIYDNSGTDVTVDVSALAGAGGSASLGGNNTFTGTNTFNGTVTLSGAFGVTDIDCIGKFSVSAEAVSALDIDLSQSNYFTKTINGNSTFTFSNPENSGVACSFTLELTHTSGTVAWPDGTGAAGIVRWPADTPPTLTAGKTHIFVFVTDDGSVSSGTGPTYRGAVLADYVN